MADQTKNKITRRLKSLEELEGVRVNVSKRNQDTVHIEQVKHHVLEFRFQWKSDHFIGYFIDANGKESQAVLSLKTPMDAIHFASAYATLNGIRAKQKQ